MLLPTDRVDPMIHHRRALINSADYYWLLRRSRGQNDDPNVAAEVSVTNVTFPSTVSSSVCRGHTHRQVSLFFIRGFPFKEQSMPRGTFSFLYAVPLFFLSFARTQN